MNKNAFRFSKPKTYIFLTILVLGGILIPIFYEPILLAIGGFLIIQDELHPADVIHVIAGEDYRLDYAILLYQQEYAKKIYVTGGGWCPHHQVVHENLWRNRAIEKEVAPEDIIIDNSKITSTYSEAERLKDWIDQSPVPINSIIVVSDPFHMRRARWAYQKVLGENIEVQMAPVPFERTPFLHSWWVDSKSWRYVRDEYQKYVYYVLRYNFSEGKFQEWLVSLDRE
jgi:uncharacterized SAM-binding protein YcdF (DUF218 family)